LNRCCAFVRDLESMLRDGMLKILLQQYLPQADICGAANEALFDHLVGQREQGGWDYKAECFGGLQVDEKVELIRQHYG
jgi:hypothetical protein